MPLSSDRYQVPLAPASVSRELHPSFDPDLNGLSAAEEAIRDDMTGVDPVEMRLVALQSQVADLRDCLVCQQDLLKRLLDVLAGR